MSADLYKIEQFSLFTFATTSYALKAEKALKNLQADFIVIPTLREISSSCGLAIKMETKNTNLYYNNLTDHEIPVESAYQVKKTSQKYDIESINLN